MALDTSPAYAPGESPKEYAKAKLLQFLPKGSTLHSSIELSRTGQSGYVRCYAIGGYGLHDHWPVNVTHFIHLVTGIRIKDRDGYNWLCVGNPGYGRADYVAEILSQALYGNRTDILGNVL